LSVNDSPQPLERSGRSLSLRRIAVRRSNWFGVPTSRIRLSEGVLTGLRAVGQARTTHQRENSHARLRLRGIAAYHASAGMLPLTLPASVEEQASRHLVEQSAVDAEHKTLAVYTKHMLKSRKKLLVLTDQPPIPHHLSHAAPGGVPRRARWLNQRHSSLLSLLWPGRGSLQNA